MPVTGIACPHCKTGLKTDLPDLGSKKVKCPKCGGSFQTNGSALTPGIKTATAISQPSNGVIKGAAVPVAAPFQPFPRPPSRANPALWLLLLIPVGLLFLAGGVGLAWYCFAPMSGPTSIQQQVTQAAPEPGRPEPVRPGDVPLPHNPPKEIQAKANDNPAKDPPAEPPPPINPEKNQPPEEKGFERPPEIQVREPQAPVTALSEEKQKEVDKAILRGVGFLKGSQDPTGTWDKKDHSLGYAALPALTLLECGVPVTDKQIQKAATYVRNASRNNYQTYEIALSILFLDKLGEPKDKPLIQTLALRLVAGQNSNGGWTYTCPNMPIPDQRLLLAFLNDNRPKLLLGKDEIDLMNPLGKLSEVPLPNAVEGGKIIKSGQLKKEPDLIPEVKNPGENNLIPSGVDPKKPATGKIVKVENLPPHLRQLPVVQPPETVRKQKAEHKDDNSNTQFAIMALWVARRHDVPMERTMALVDSRFRVSQQQNGGWAYQFLTGGATPSMTCVGLLGLAVGHGTAAELRSTSGQIAAPGAALQQDPAIEKGLKALGQHIERPGKGKNATMPSLYFLWSVERVAVLYQLKTIGSKDWYGWGVELLVPRQEGNGSWLTKSYHGSSSTIDTCLALLFLKRANLVQDLSNNLLYMGITDPDERPLPKR